MPSMIIDVLKRVALAVLTLTSIFLMPSCDTTNESFWDAVEFTEGKNSLVLMLSSSGVPPAGDYGTPVIDSMKNNLMSDVNGSRLHYLSLYPQTIDPLYHPNAESFLFLYDSNGDNSMTGYPAFVANTVNYNYDLASFKSALDAQANGTEEVSVGNLIHKRGANLDMYIKLRYNVDFYKEHAVAVYSYRKEVVSEQATSTQGTLQAFAHKNVLKDFVNGAFGSKVSTSTNQGDEHQIFYTYNIADEDLDNLGFLTIVYELDSSGNAVDVINVYMN